MNESPRWGLEEAGLAALLLAALGQWGEWIYHKVTALNLNAFYLSEWATYLLDVRYGDLKAAPEIMRLGLALGGAAAAIGLGVVKDWRWRWAIRAALAPIGVVLLPPYPDVFSLWWSPSYGGRFAAASAFWLGLAACWWIDRQGAAIRRWLAVACCVGALAGALGGFALLTPPFEAHYAETLQLGWGRVAFGGGLLIGGGIQVALARIKPKENQKGPVS